MHALTTCLLFKNTGNVRANKGLIWLSTERLSSYWGYMGSYFWFSVFVASNALLLFMLAMRVSLLRLKLGISTGDGDNPLLFKAIRAHSNGVEQVPMFALLVLALSFNQLRSDYLAALVIVFTLARVCHGVGMNYRIFRARQLGAGLTYLLHLVAVAILTVILLQ